MIALAIARDGARRLGGAPGGGRRGRRPPHGVHALRRRPGGEPGRPVALAGRRAEAGRPAQKAELAVDHLPCPRGTRGRLRRRRVGVRGRAARRHRRHHRLRRQGDLWALPGEGGRAASSTCRPSTPPSASTWATSTSSTSCASPARRGSGASDVDADVVVELPAASATRLSLPPGGSGATFNRWRRSGRRGAVGMVAAGGALALAARTARADGAFPDGQTILAAGRSPRRDPAGHQLRRASASEDAGRSWIWSCEQPVNSYGRLYQMGPAPAHRLYAIANGKLVFSDDGACGWQAAGGALGAAALRGRVRRSDRRHARAGRRADVRRGGRRLHASSNRRDGGATFDRARSTPARRATSSPGSRSPRPIR